MEIQSMSGTDSLDSLPTITTVIPTYRRPKQLSRAIRSVLNQTFANFEVYVYDDASGDETASVVAEIATTDNRVKYYCHPANIGSTRNFSYAMERVSTPFFSVLSDDDLLLPEFYRLALAGFDKYPEAVCSATATLDVDVWGNILSVPLLAWKPGLYLPPQGLVSMLKNMHPSWNGVLFRREVIQTVGNLDEEVGLVVDLDFELRAAARCPIAVSLQPGAMLVSHPGSLSSGTRFNSLWPGWLKIVRNLTEDTQLPDDIRTYAEHVLMERLKSWLFVSGGFGCIVRKNWQDALQAADVLGNHYHLRVRARLLRCAAKLCRYLPPAYYLLLAAHTLRSLIHGLFKGVERKRLKSDYGMYIRHLEL